jgi:4'-phosphopantetheinyl transferase
MEDIRFNLSHSEGIALYAFSKDHEVGVDIERIHDIPEMDLIAAQVFSEWENRVFRKLSKNEKKQAFFECWTRKEAFIKAVGEGLSLSLDKFDVSLGPGESARLLKIQHESKEASRWCLRQISPAPGFAAALAVRKHGLQLNCWQYLQ